MVRLSCARPASTRTSANASIFTCHSQHLFRITESRHRLACPCDRDLAPLRVGYMKKPDEKLIAACEACVTHARDLLESAKLVQTSGRVNIAYHLATLALEEMGRRELFQIQSAATSVGDTPRWQMSATQDHVQKLFWCFYGMGRIQDVVDQNQFFEKKAAAADV